MIKALLILLSTTVAFGLQAAQPVKPKWQLAKDLLDEHFDDSKVLNSAAKLLVAARSETPQDANVLVQAARLTAKGGQVSQSGLRPGTLEAYTDLLERALKSDPNHKKALILRAEAYSLSGDYIKEKATLERAKSAPGVDRWLQIGLARYFSTVKDSTAAYYSYKDIEELGPGDAMDQRNAYVYALFKIATFRPPEGEPFRIIELSELAHKHRSLRDYETPAKFAELLLFHGHYPEAVKRARESLDTKSTHDATLTLSAALYGMAGIHKSDGNQAEALRFATDAKKYGFTRAQILRRISGPSSTFATIEPKLDELLE